MTIPGLAAIAGLAEPDAALKEEEDQGGRYEQGCLVQIRGTGRVVFQICRDIAQLQGRDTLTSSVLRRWGSSDRPRRRNRWKVIWCQITGTTDPEIGAATRWEELGRS